jgi:hypothetical protein
MEEAYTPETSTTSPTNTLGNNPKTGSVTTIHERESLKSIPFVLNHMSISNF